MVTRKDVMKAVILERAGGLEVQSYRGVPAQPLRALTMTRALTVSSLPPPWR